MHSPPTEPSSTSSVGVNPSSTPPYPPSTPSSPNPPHAKTAIWSQFKPTSHPNLPSPPLVNSSNLTSPNVAKPAFRFSSVTPVSEANSCALTAKTPPRTQNPRRTKMESLKTLSMNFGVSPSQTVTISSTQTLPEPISPVSASYPSSKVELPLLTPPKQFLSAPMPPGQNYQSSTPSTTFPKHPFPTWARS